MMKYILRITKVFIIAFALNIFAGLGAWADDGLVAHYTFNEGQGTIVKDASGNGCDGQISGGTSFVERSSGYALHFDGKTGYVDFKIPDALAINGDMAFEAWVNGYADAGEDDIIFGQGASGAVGRNYYIINSNGSLRFEHGDGINSEAFSAPAVFDGKWHHIAIVIEHPVYYIFVDGREVGRGKMNVKLKVTEKFSYQMGGWWAGHFRGEIDDVRIYKRAISANEIAVNAGLTPNIKPNLSISVKPLSLQRKIEVKVDIDSLGVQNAKLRVSLQTPGLKKEMVKVISFKETRPGSGRGSAIAGYDFKSVELTKGTYLVSASILSSDGKTIAKEKNKWQMPEWVGSRAGITDKVLSPWTPVKTKKLVKNGSTRVDISVFGRTYSFANSLFPSSIVTHGKEILSQPMRVVLKSNGKLLPITDIKVTLGNTGPAFAELKATGRVEGFLISVKHRLEYDGFIWSTWKVESKSKKTLDELAFEIPFKSENAHYQYYSTLFGNPELVKTVGSVKEGVFSRSFTPFVWLGDEERGLEWMCDSDRNWHPKNIDNAIRITKTDDEVVFRACLVEKSIEITPSHGLNYNFGFQASPVKPIVKDGWDYRAAFGPYGHDYDLLTMKVGEQSALDYCRDQGVNTIIITNWTKIMAYTSPVGHEDDLRNLVRECHKRRIKVIPYFGYQISERAPEWPVFGNDVIKLPDQSNFDSYPDMPGQTVRSVCYRSVWRDFLVDTIGKLMDEYDLDGIYLDGTVCPQECMNTAHGCGYINSDGVLKPTYPMLETRETLRRLYKVVKSRKPDGIIDAHVGDMMYLPALSWATIYWNGEQIRPANTPGTPGYTENYTSVMPLDRFRTEMMGVQWGIPCNFLHYMLGDFKKCLAISLLHNILPRGADIRMSSDFKLNTDLWRLYDKYDLKKAQWLPYWKNADYVRAESGNTYVSLYNHPKKGVIAVVSNLGTQSQATRIKLDIKKLSISGKNLKAVDAMTGEIIPIADGNMTFDLQVLGWRIVWISE